MHHRNEDGMTDETNELERRLARAAGVAAFFQLGTLAWVRRRGLDLDDYLAYLASFTWSSLEPGIGARRVADIMAAQVATSGAFSATATGDDGQAWIDLVGPDAELLAWAGADADDLYREVELVYTPALLRLGHRIELVRGPSAARITIRRAH
jgi:hypothetical protein